MILPKTSQGKTAASENEDAQSEYSVGSLRSLVGVSCVITSCVIYSANDPNYSSEGTHVRHLQSTHHQQKQKLRVAFQCILVRSLYAVEGHVFTRVHGRVWYFEFLSRLPHFDGLPSEEEDGADGGEYNVSVAIRKWRRFDNRPDRR